MLSFSWKGARGERAKRGGSWNEAVTYSWQRCWQPGGHRLRVSGPFLRVINKNRNVSWPEFAILGSELAGENL